ncbi:hypothetical protein C0991_012339 [Blastosporella zonata]|nr:hypothetical protein C0991_012339 [Blastosporella zonata]
MSAFTEESVYDWTKNNVPGAMGPSSPSSNDSPLLEEILNTLFKPSNTSNDESNRESMLGLLSVSNLDVSDASDAKSVWGDERGYETPETENEEEDAWADMPKLQDVRDSKDEGEDGDDNGEEIPMYTHIELLKELQTPMQADADETHPNTGVYSLQKLPSNS